MKQTDKKLVLEKVGVFSGVFWSITFFTYFFKNYFADWKFLRGLGELLLRGSTDVISPSERRRRRGGRIR